jgi:hypothetical protein
MRRARLASFALVGIIMSLGCQASNGTDKTTSPLTSWNDGTLWSEQPIYFQALFAIDRVRAVGLWST